MLDESFVMKDFKKYKDMPQLLHIQSQNFFLTYPQLVSKAMQNFVRVDGTPKPTRKRRTLRILRQGALLERLVRRRLPLRAGVALSRTMRR